MGQLYSVSTLGGNWTVPYLTDKLRHVAQPRYMLRQFCDVREAIGTKRGDTWNWDKAGNVATAGGVLVETSTIPETEYVTNQGTGTIGELGNAVPWTGKLDALGKFEVDSITEQKLRDDMVKVIESAAGDEFKKTELYAVCSATNSVAFTTNGQAAATATADLTAANVRSIVDYMKKKFIPTYDGKNYVCVASISSLSGMHADSGTGGWVDLAKYNPTYSAQVFNGEVGTFYTARFVEETGYLSNTIGSGSTHGQCFFIGADNVQEAVAIPEEIRLKNSNDYGRDLGMAWYALLGFKLVWDYDVDGEQHVVFVTSA